MHFRPCFGLVLLMAVPGALASSPLKIVAHYPIPGEVRYDYLTVDAQARRLYVSHGTRVDVLDADTGKEIGQIGPLKGIHGIAVVPELGRGFITSGSDHEVAAFNLNTLAIEKVIEAAGPKPDSIRYDPATRRIRRRQRGVRRHSVRSSTRRLVKSWRGFPLRGALRK